ncbi:MAG TPA: precorrin-6y C5,15-methyltransferase (decarboxylating) subunit CbiE [Pirellulales bacterium]|jgi:precorrin-6Y C5,15-methyltransferase (decarboxylating)|nr:precorrin-6y C5,15-methyltransferase (decarboxylating) subunit CbiE [Pirellulales bacterium]
MDQKVVVVGIGDNGADSLSREALRRVSEAEVLLGGERHLAFFPDHPAEKLAIRDNLKEIAARLQGETRRVAVLASGDPLFYGIAGYLATKIGRDRLEVLPNISSMQLAFARLKESWHDAALVSCHAKPIEEAIDVIRDAKKVAIFTDDENTPARISREILRAGIGGFRAHVCENLGGRDERITSCDLSELAERSFSPLNVLVLVRKAEAPVLQRRDWTFGIPEEAFYQRQPLKGLITKTEVRVLSLAKMRLRPGNTVWDIGAGSGSVSIEAALLGANVWAIEKNKEDCDIIRRNIEKFGTPQITVLQGVAPAALAELPDPDAVFIGGSGGEMGELVRICRERLLPGGRLVINVATLENLGEVPASDVTLVQVSRTRPILNLHRFEALNPVFIACWEKE